MLAPIQHLKMHRFSWPVLDMTMGQQSPVAEPPSVARGTSRPISSCQCGLGGRAGGMWTGAELAAVSCQLAVRCQPTVSQMWDVSQLSARCEMPANCQWQLVNGHHAWHMGTEGRPGRSAHPPTTRWQFNSIVFLCHFVFVHKDDGQDTKNAKQLFIKLTIISIVAASEKQNIYELCNWGADYVFEGICWYMTSFKFNLHNSTSQLTLLGPKEGISTRACGSCVTRSITLSTCVYPLTCQILDFGWSR